MARLTLGPRVGMFARLIAAVAPPTSTAPTSTPPVKTDVAPAVKSFDGTLDPLPVVLTIPAYDPATFNSLQSITIVALPEGHGEPVDANAWMGSVYPKATVALATPPVPVDPNAPAAVPAMTSAPVAPATPVPVVVYLPGPEGGDVTISIPGVPNGNQLLQTVLQFDV